MRNTETKTSDPAILDATAKERPKLRVPRAISNKGKPIVSIGTLPLAKFTVLDLCHARAGPTAVRQFADWGANVIKIEPPGEARGDVTGSPGHGFHFLN